MSLQKTRRELPQGCYEHYKSTEKEPKLYDLEGIAIYDQFAALSVTPVEEKAILSGTENHDEPVFFQLFVDMNGYYYFDTEFEREGVREDELAVYRPQYGEGRLTVRSAIEFAETVEGDQQRFRFVA